jgi:glycosyltransferase involved in cell wall biosynthesis
MRLLMLPPSWDAGGAERVALSLAGARAESGDEVVLAAPRGSLDGTPLPVGVERSVVAAGGRGPLGAALGAAAVARAARRARPELVHAHNPRATASAWLAAAVARGRPPVVSTYHGVRAEDRRAAARVLARATEVVCVSEDLRLELERAGFPTGRARVVANGVAAAAQLPDERERALRAELGLEGSVVTLVGRLVEQKAPERFVEAAAELRRRGADVTFLVVGTGPLLPELERRAAALGAGSGIRFTGLRDDARDLIALSDLLVFTSIWEGLSIAALEALAAGVPVVAAGVSGMRDLLGSGAGLIVEDATPPAFARAIESLLDDPAARAAMGERGRALVEERYSVRAMAAGYAEVYDAALGRRP